MERPLILLHFWVFLYIIDDHSGLKYRIFIKLSQIMYLTDEHILLCQYRTIYLSGYVRTLNTDSLKNKAKQITVKAFFNLLHLNRSNS